MIASHKIILYFALAVLAIFGLLLLVFRVQVLETLSPPPNFSAWADDLKLTPGDLPPADLWQSPVLASLHNYAPNFDFDNICWRPEAVVIRPDSQADESTGAVGAPPTPAACSKGSGLPFFISRD